MPVKVEVNKSYFDKRGLVYHIDEVVGFNGRQVFRSEGGCFYSDGTPCYFGCGGKSSYNDLNILVSEAKSFEKENEYGREG